MEAARWYAAESDELAQRFQLQIDDAIAEIRTRPLAYRMYMHQTRRFLLSDFPYLVVYRARRRELQVFAFAHGSRRPG